MKLSNCVLFTLILICIALTGCKKKTESALDPNGLPKASQTGAMIFACKAYRLIKSSLPIQSFNSSHRVGSQNKYVAVFLNIKDKVKILSFEGEVIRND